MRLKKLVVAGAATVLAGAAVGLACPAWADDPAGAYTVTWSDSTPPTTWTFTPCGPGCSQVTGNKGWSTDAHLVNSRWVMGPVHYTLYCSDGSTVAATANGSFDAATLTGSSVVTYPVACPKDPVPSGMTIQFSLTKVARNSVNIEAAADEILSERGHTRVGQWEIVIDDGLRYVPDTPAYRAEVQ